MVRRSRAAFLLVVALAASVCTMSSRPAAAADAYILIPAGAGRAGCPAGYVCLWEYANFSGRGVAFYNGTGFYGNLSPTYSWINNYAESAFNNGNNGDIRFGRFSNLRGGTFVLCKKDSISHFPSARDEGSGTATDDDNTRPGYRWRNEISSHEFFTSYWC